MKIFLLTLLLMLSLSFAVQPVPKSARNVKDDDKTKTAVKNEVVNKNGDTDKQDKGEGNDDNNKNDIDKGNHEAKIDLKGKIKNITDRNGDKIVDADSNNVNDQRERDFDKIKQLESKFKDLFKRDNNKDNDKEDNKDEDKDSKTRKPEPKKAVPPSKHRPGK